jgi:hypothetical protein
VAVNHQYYDVMTRKAPTRQLRSIAPNFQLSNTGEGNEDQVLNLGFALSYLKEGERDVS